MATENKRDIKKARRDFLVYLIILILIPICAFTRSWIKQLNIGRRLLAQEATSYNPQPTSDLIGNVGISLPESARDVYEYGYGLNAVYTMVRFTIDAEDLDEIIESSICEEPLVQVPPENYAGGLDDTDWWLPEKATILMQCDGFTENFWQSILVDMSNPQEFIIYATSSFG